MPADIVTLPAKCRVKPYAQGDLDYLCAVYAIINASRALCPEMTEEFSISMFRFLIRAMAKHRKNVLLPLIVGIDRSLVLKLLSDAGDYLSRRLNIILTIEAQRKELRAKSLPEAWTRLSEVLADQTVVLIAVSGRKNHWTILFDVKPDRLRLIDSLYRRKLKRSQCTLRPTQTRFRLHLASAIAISRLT